MEPIASTLGIINSITELLTKATDIAKKKKESEFLSIVADIQLQIIELRKQDEELAKKLDLSDKIVRHSDGLYVTLRGDPDSIRYCSTCWGKDGKLIQIGSHQCNVCHTWLLGYKDDLDEIKRDHNKPKVINTL